VESPTYLDQLRGTLGAEPLEPYRSAKEN
jgi:hypothetical protein